MRRKWIGALVLTLAAMLFASAALAASRGCDGRHSYRSWQTKTSATCTRQGHQFRYCRNCDHWEQRYTKRLPHTPGEWTVTQDATCTQEGVQETVCQVCGNVVRRRMDKLAHRYGEMTVEKEPSCTQNGTGMYACTVCGGHKRETLEKLGHDWGETAVVKAPTCSSTGEGARVCLRCGREGSVRIDRLAHVYGEWTVTREPEGKRKGLRERACTLCGGADQALFYPEGTLYEEMEPCEEVITLQERLRDLGYYSGSIRSGQFGSLTARAVARFQAEHALEETGLADAQTQAAVAAEWEKATGKSAAPTLAAQEMERAEEAQPMTE